jgi:hypothetical protein
MSLFEMCIEVFRSCVALISKTLLKLDEDKKDDSNTFQTKDFEFIFVPSTLPGHPPIELPLLLEP